jgi:hypothetical protein
MRALEKGNETIFLPTTTWEPRGVEVSARTALQAITSLGNDFSDKKRFGKA